MNIFVGNLSFAAVEDDVRRLFETFGIVEGVRIKKKSGKNSRGFGFVCMPDALQAQAAIEGLEAKDFMGRPLSVTQERPKVLKPKKNYKEIKKARLETKNTKVAVFDAPVIPERLVPSSKKIFEAKKSAQPRGGQTWEKRKGRGTAKPWKKKPGGVNKKFKHAR